jgi:hypothetical protein
LKIIIKTGDCSNERSPWCKYHQGKGTLFSEWSPRSTVHRHTQVPFVLCLFVCLFSKDYRRVSHHAIENRTERPPQFTSFWQTLWLFSLKAAGNDQTELGLNFAIYILILNNSLTSMTTISSRGMTNYPADLLNLQRLTY